MSEKKSAYLMPGGTASSEQVISKSRFIATLSHTGSKDSTMRFIKEVSSAHPGAHHNAYAYIIGDPGGSSETGYSDDGEVSGCAGKPVLSILQHKGIGDVAAVVTRYYGGTKLGTGGLVRAYSGTLMMALDKLELKERVATVQVSIQITYQYESPLRALFKKHGVIFPEPEYTDTLTVRTDIPEDKAEEIKNELMNMTRGSAKIST